MCKKILICGLGSMGKRRIRIIQSLFPDHEIFGTDLREDRRAEVEDKFNIRTMENFYGAFSIIKPEIVFACTSPLAHSEFVIYALENNAHTFSEINLSAKGYDRILKAARGNNKTAFLSSTFLYREEIRWIIEMIKSHNNISYRYHVGQYLPDWHPWENYKDFFVFQEETSACKEIMAIDFPWVLKAFGKVKTVRAVKRRSLDLDLDYEDTFHILFEHENGICGSVSIDCASVRGVRKLEIYSDKLYLEWEGTPESLKIYSPETKKMIPVELAEKIEKDEEYDEFVLENPYVNEIKEFFSILEGNTNSQLYTYEDDLNVINLIKELHLKNN